MSQQTGNRPENEPSGTTTGVAPGDFAVDVGPRSVREAFVAYGQKVRGGDVGALPALLGIVVLLAVFNEASPVFLTIGNLANVPAQAAATALIAMGLVFVLLLGEIDLSAGTASGVCAGTMALALNREGDLQAALGSGTFATTIVLMLAAVGLAAWSRLWLPVGIVGAGTVLLLTGAGSHVVVAIALAISVGVAIGTLTGFLVARVGIPSFVVTLALFLTWQGVLLKLIGTGNAIPVREFEVINGLANKNLAPVYGWLFLAVTVGSYVAYTVIRSIRRRAEGLSAEPLGYVLARAAALTAIGAFGVYFLNLERSPNPEVASIRGMPYIVPIVILLMIFWTIVLTRTAFGRHLYAVGGNTEAARRAGIDVAKMRMAAFMICSGMAALGGIVAASKLGGVPADAGGGNQLLFAVGAAVIGGTSLFGGRGRPRDAVLGALVIQLIPNGLGLTDLDSSYNFILTGLVLLLAASVDALSRKRAAVAGR
ncbi:MAG: sugar ABC transporter permease [Actinomycetes bacterium]